MQGLCTPCVCLSVGVCVSVTALVSATNPLKAKVRYQLWQAWARLHVSAFICLVGGKSIGLQYTGDLGSQLAHGFLYLFSNNIPISPTTIRKFDSYYKQPKKPTSHLQSESPYKEHLKQEHCCNRISAHSPTASAVM